MNSKWYVEAYWASADPDDGSPDCGGETEVFDSKEEAMRWIVLGDGADYDCFVISEFQGDECIWSSGRPYDLWFYDLRLQYSVEQFLKNAIAEDGSLKPNMLDVAFIDDKTFADENKTVEYKVINYTPIEDSPYYYDAYGDPVEFTGLGTGLKITEKKKDGTINTMYLVQQGWDDDSLVYMLRDGIELVECGEQSPFIEPEFDSEAMYSEWAAQDEEMEAYEAQMEKETAEYYARLEAEAQLEAEGYYDDDYY